MKIFCGMNLPLRVKFFPDEAKYFSRWLHTASIIPKRVLRNFPTWLIEEQAQLDKEMEEYNKLYLTALANKYKLSGKDLFSAIEREHDQLEKLREGEQSDDDADNTSSVTDDEDKQDDTAVKHSSFPHSYSGGN